MQLLNTVTLYMGLALFLLILTVVAGFFLIILANRKKSSITEVYYDSFERRDSMEYLKFDEIVSSDPEEPLNGAGVIVVNQKTFTSAINVIGYNFFSASYDSQVNTINAAISMFDALEYPISLRQTVKAIDISHNIDVFAQRAEELRKEANDVYLRAQDLLAEAEDYLDVDPQIANSLIADANRLKLIVSRKNHQYEEAIEMVQYMEEISTKSGDNQKVQTIGFSYTYDGTQFTSQLSKEEIYMQAMQELSSRAANLCANLFRCGCSARRCSAEELVDLMRRHMHPLTGDDYSIRDLFNSNLDALFVTSDSLLSVIKEQMTEEAYEKRQLLLEQRIAEEEKQRMLLAERAETDRKAITKEIAAGQIHI